MTFHFTTLWGQADGNSPALSTALHNRKSLWGRNPNVKTFIQKFLLIFDCADLMAAFDFLILPEGNSSSGHPQHRGGDNLTVAQKDLKKLFYYPTRTYRN